MAGLVKKILFRNGCKPLHASTHQLTNDVSLFPVYETTLQSKTLQSSKTAVYKSDNQIHKSYHDHPLLYCFVTYLRETRHHKFHLRKVLLALAYSVERNRLWFRRPLTSDYYTNCWVQKYVGTLMIASVGEAQVEISHNYLSVVTVTCITHLRCKTAGISCWFTSLSFQGANKRAGLWPKQSYSTVITFIDLRDILSEFFARGQSRQNICYNKWIHSQIFFYSFFQYYITAIW